MPERCLKCGGPLTYFNRGGELVFDCHYNQKDCRIKELENRVRELTQRDPDWYDASPADAFSMLTAAQEKIAELRDDPKSRLAAAKVRT